MARRPNEEKVEIFSEKDLEELRYNLLLRFPQGSCTLHNFYTRSGNTA